MTSAINNKSKHKKILFSLYFNFLSVINIKKKMWFVVALYKEKKLLSENTIEMEVSDTFGDLLFELV